jgi:hypothetical protein
MRGTDSPKQILLKDTSSRVCADPTASNSLVLEQPLVDYETNLLARRLLTSTKKSNHSRQSLKIFESESRNTNGASSKQLKKKRPMFLDPPDNVRTAGTPRRKKRRLKKEKIMMKHQSSLSSCSTTVTTPAANPRRRRSDLSHREWCDWADISSPDMKCHGDSSSHYYDGGSTPSWKQTQEEGPGRRRAMSPCPPSPPIHPQQMPDFQQGLEIIGSSFDVEDNDLLMMLEPIELSEAAVHPPEIEHIELKKRLSYEDQHHAYQQQLQGCFGQMRSNTDNYSSIQAHHCHPQHQYQQHHFAVTMHHHQQFQNNIPRYYPNTHPANGNNAAAQFVDKRNGWSWSFQTGMHY